MREPLSLSLHLIEISHVSISKSSITLRRFNSICQCFPFGLHLQKYGKDLYQTKKTHAFCCFLLLLIQQCNKFVFCETTSKETTTLFSHGGKEWTENKSLTPVSKLWIPPTKDIESKIYYGSHTKLQATALGLPETGNRRTHSPLSHRCVRYARHFGTQRRHATHRLC